MPGPIKISQLPAATTPLTGNETLPLAVSGKSLKTGIGVAQVKQAFGGLPTNPTIGTIGFTVDAAGGRTMVYYDGVQWKPFNAAQAGTKVNTMGEGLWVVGAGKCDLRSPAHNIPFSRQPGVKVPLDRGFYFYSLDGQHWFGFLASRVLLGISISIFPAGITGISYANGCWLVGGLAELIDGTTFARVATILDPTLPDDRSKGFNFEPPQGFSSVATGTVALSPTDYDPVLDVFTVPILPAGGTVLVQNKLPSSLTPDKDWPYIGQDGGEAGGFAGPSPSIAGMGTNGPVEVRINNTFLDVKNRTILDEATYNYPGIFSTDYLQWRRRGTMDWNPVDFFQLSGQDTSSAGLSLRGLVWGVVKQTCVKCLPGSD